MEPSNQDSHDPASRRSDLWDGFQVLHEDRRRAGSFGSDAVRYDRLRPSYPDELVTELCTGDVSVALDVGCGTGIASRLFRAQGCDVIGVEPDTRMAKLATDSGIEVAIDTFESWEPGGRRFDLVISGQAWHWVNPSTGPEKAASVLRPGGRVGLFWNHGVIDGSVAEPLNDLYRRRAAAVDEYSVLLGRAGPDRYLTVVEDLVRTGRFDDVEILNYNQHTDYTTTEWVVHLLTHSDHHDLDRQPREELFTEIAAILDGNGGGLAMRNDTYLVHGRRT